MEERVKSLDAVSDFTSTRISTMEEGTEELGFSVEELQIIDSFIEREAKVYPPTRSGLMQNYQGCKALTIGRLLGGSIEAPLRGVEPMTKRWVNPQSEIYLLRQKYENVEI